MRSSDAATIAMAPMAIVPRLTPSPEPGSKAGVRMSSVTRPSTTVPPTAMKANSVAPTRETAKGRFWARTDAQSRRTPRRVTDSSASPVATGRT